MIMIIISQIKKASANLIKVLRFGNKDIQTAQPLSIAGIDSCPIDNNIAIYAETSNKSKPIILGYLNDNQSNNGEIKIYSQDTNGNKLFELYFKNDGTVEFGGNTDNLVKFSILDSLLQTFISNLNTQLITALAPVPFTWVPITLDLSTAKNLNIKQ